MRLLLNCFFVLYFSSLFADYELYEHWRYKHATYDQSSIIIDKISSKNPEILFSWNSGEIYFVSLLNGKTKDVIFTKEFGGCIIGVFDLNYDGYKEIYSYNYDAWNPKQFTCIDGRDSSTHIDSLELPTLVKWYVTYNNTMEDSILIASGWEDFAVYSLPDLKLIKSSKYCENEYNLCTGIIVDDTDKDGKREIVFLASSEEYKPSRIEFYDLETLQFKSKIDFSSKQFMDANYLNYIDINGDNYEDFIFSVKTHYYNGKTIILDGATQEIIHEYPTEEFCCSIVSPYEDKKLYMTDIYSIGGYSQLAIYSIQPPYNELWKSEALDMSTAYLCLASGDLDENGKTDILFALGDTLLLYNSDKIGFSKDSSTKYLPAEKISAFPNPFRNILSIILPKEGSIYSLTGQLIKKLNKGRHELDTFSWREGVYIVKSDNEFKKIVKVD